MKKKFICVVLLIANIVLLTSCGLFKKKTVTVDGIIYEKNGEDGKEYYSAVDVADHFAKSLVIAAEIDGKPVKTIKTGAFGGCSKLESIVIPNGIVTIEYEAFRNCISLMSIVIPESVKTIARYEVFGGVVDRFGAFSGCYNLVEVINYSSIEIEPDGGDFVVNGYDLGNIGEYALGVHRGESKIVEDDGFVYYEDDEICYLVGYRGDEKNITLPETHNGRKCVIRACAFIGSQLENVVVPDGITEIRSSTFARSNIKTVRLPGSLERVASDAFSNTKDIEVYFDGTEEEWAALDIDEYYFNATVHCNDSVVEE